MSNNTGTTSASINAISSRPIRLTRPPRRADASSTLRPRLALGGPRIVISSDKEESDKEANTSHIASPLPAFLDDSLFDVIEDAYKEDPFQFRLNRDAILTSVDISAAEIKLTCKAKEAGEDVTDNTIPQLKDNQEVIFDYSEALSQEVAQVNLADNIETNIFQVRRLHSYDIHKNNSFGKAAVRESFRDQDQEQEQEQNQDLGQDQEQEQEKEMDQDQEGGTEEHGQQGLGGQENVCAVFLQIPIVLTC